MPSARRRTQGPVHGDDGVQAGIYRRASESGVWSRPGFEGIAYSDGGESERALLEVLRGARDLSTLSDELNEAIDGWMREAHLSPSRCNLLRPFRFRPGSRVLELGAGCGAITRYLGEQELAVDAVEGNPLRAECAAERCRDLANVRVFADEISSFVAGHKYDVVTLIGVLEYSRLFIDGDDAVRRCLELARGHLAPGGVLVLAIENQLGLKYFNGCAEDHLGTRYSGLTDLYTRKTAVTFGKAELGATLGEAGFARIDWYYPFPDYKLPTTVIASRALADPGFRAGDMLLGEFARDYAGGNLRSFDEPSVWGLLERNGLMGELANSFLVLAATGDTAPPDEGGLAWRYSPQRQVPFATSTRIARDASGHIKATKASLAGASHAPARPPELGLVQRLGEERYVSGRLLACDFIDAVARGYGARDLAQFLKPWVDFLAAHATAPGAAGLANLRLPGEYLDCIPTNLVVDERGELHAIDQEFAVPGDIPLPWVVHRGTVHLASKCFGHRTLATTSFGDFLAQILPALGLGAITDWKPYCDLEDALIRTVLRPWKGRPERDILHGRLQLPIAVYQSLPEAYERARPAETLLAQLTRWLKGLPEPSETPAAPDEPVPELLELADRTAAELERVTGTPMRGRMRELSMQRIRWATLARENQRLAWELNDAQGQLDGVATRERGAVAATSDSARKDGLVDALKAEAFTLRTENSALKYEVGEARARAEESAAALAARESELASAVARHQELSRDLEAARGEAADREAALAEAAAREREAVQALGREQGRAETLAAELASLKGDRNALVAEAAGLRTQLANALHRIKRRGLEIARLHRHAADDVARRRALELELRSMQEAATWRLTTSLRAFYKRHPGLWDFFAGRRSRPGVALPEGAEDQASLQRRQAAVEASGLFDAPWYARRYAESLEPGVGAIAHYLLVGWQREFDPNPLFHERWYRRNNQGLIGAAESGLEHFIREGAAKGLAPNPIFDPAWYLNANPDVAAYAAGPLHHYLHRGAQEGRDPHPLFDTRWFLDQYPDARTSGENPLAYFLETAATTGQSPCELFDTAWYLASYPDVEERGENPLVHYLVHGAREGRDPSADFDTDWYLETYPDIAASGVNPLVHYRVAGMLEGRQPTARRTDVAQAPAFVAEPVADGVREWRDYEPLKQRIAAEARQVLAAVEVEAPEMVSVAEDGIDAAIARLAFATHEKPRVSIVIPAYGKLALTLECLESVARAATQVPFEVIVADDASPDGTAGRLRAVPGLAVLRNEENLGFLRNCNAAIPKARGEYVLLLNNDVQVTSGWLDALVGTFTTFERVGAVGPKIVYPSGHLQEAGVAFRADGSAEMVGLNDDPKLERYNYARPVDHVSGACLLVPAALLRELGGFSEEFLPCYCEDSDLALRIRAKGLRVFYQPAATIVHHLSKTTADGSSDLKVRAVASSMATFALKWQQELDRLSDVRLLAFYLPQFHPIPENDHWWGPGFTEWSNVGRARPNFVGHYQPRVPADLGYYDLRLPEVMQAQADLARRYGVHGFVCYYYWFAGKRLLEAPVERLLATGEPDIPYCLCWANENWTRRWDGADREILVSQKHSPEDDEAVILDLIRHFRGANYIRIDGKPLMLVYRVNLFPDFRATAERWRRICRREGVGDIYLAMVESFDLVHAGAHPAQYNCDAAVEFPPLGMAQMRPPSGAVLNPDFLGHAADYRDIAARFCARPLPGHTRFRGVMVGWDNTARRQNHSFCFENSTPGAFQAWLEVAIAQTRAQYHGDERLVFVNAWNEWAEAAYLEPDRRYGHTFLEAVRNAHDAERLLRLGRYALDA
jgi:GT2 family glycosyltransferase